MLLNMMAYLFFSEFPIPIHFKIMAKVKHKGPGAEFTDQQKNIDQAINENKKSATGKKKLDPEQQNTVDYKSDVDVKKAGRVKHK
jgi:hypothetical protein